MRSLSVNTDEITAIQQLDALLPSDQRSQITIVSAPPSNHFPISAQAIEPSKFAIQINFKQWQQFTASQQDLLFWHEISGIQASAIGRSNWQIIAIIMGLSAASMELPSHSVLAVAVALTVAGLAVYRLYQSSRGEQSLRKLTAADRAAIELAMRSGYSFTQAHSSLYEALKILAKQPTLKAQRRQYQTRLRVLEILESNWNTGFDPIIFAASTR
jgi:Protein of unknown function (DUF3318)